MHMNRLLSIILFCLLAFANYAAFAQDAGGLEAERQTYRVPEQRGVGVMLELALPQIIQPDLIIGYHFNSTVFVGAGVGLYIPGIGGSLSVDSSVPVFADVRVSFGDWRWSPYISADLGFFPGQKPNNRAFTLKEDLYSSVSVGVRLRNRDRSRRNSFWFGVKMEFTHVEWPFMPFLKLGYSF